MSNQTLTVTDNRTGQTYTLPIENGAIKATDLRQIRLAEADDPGLCTYDPGFMNTAACKSRITYIDGDQGILEYRGYPIEQLAGSCTYLEVAYLLVHGELPTSSELNEFVHDITYHTILHENMKQFMAGFRYDAHPMGMFVSTVAAMATFYPEAKNIGDAGVRRKQLHRLIAKVPTIGAFIYRHNQGLPYAYPDNELSYTGNFLNMLYRRTESKYKVNPVLEKALEILFILHADHEQNCSTTAMRSVGSAHTDQYSSLAAAAAALYGPLHGGANEAVLKMLRTIGSKAGIPEYIKRAKSGELRLMGFGHRVYKNYDPRARIIKQAADEVFEVTGKNPLIDIAVELERIALEDDYFIKRKLYPNVDFYSGIIYEAMGIPTEMFTVMFAIPRTVGWLTHYEEMLTDSDQKIARPKQVYLGPARRDFVPMAERSATMTAKS
jgi:citrate synthase